VTYRVVVADRIATRGTAILAAAPEIELVEVAGKGRQALEAVLPEAHALLVRSETRVTADVIRRARQLKVIARAGTGVDTIDVAAATRSGIAVLNAPGANTVSTAEHTMALLLALVRHIPDAVVSMRKGEWERKRFEGAELRGKTLGVIGLGRIGGQVAQLAKAFAMRVLAHDPYVTGDQSRGAELVSLEKLLAESDIVTLHLALTDRTRHFLNAGRIGVMKPGAVLVNAARGELVDEAALLAALDTGQLAGAALDVFSTEPLPAEHPLRRHERVLVTPHLAASTAEAQERVATEICAAVRDALLAGDISSAINVPGVTREALIRLATALDLARLLGRLAAGLVGGPVLRVEVSFGGNDEDAPRPVQLAAVEGILRGLGVSQVSIVNAHVLATERGMVVSRRVGPAEAGYAMTVGVEASSASGRVGVIGGLGGEGRGRLVRVDDYRVDLVPTDWMLVLRNRDVPGVIGRVGTVLGQTGINIASYHQARREAPIGEDNTALAVIAVDQEINQDVLDALRTLPEVIDVRFAHLAA